MSGADIAARVAAMDTGGLRAEWRRLYRREPPARVGRGVLELAVAHRLQERAHGGLWPAPRRRLAALVRDLETGGAGKLARAVHLKPGARLVRVWHGTTHSVLVTEDGYEWRGERWRSLSAIARAITGQRWSGPRFFGLTGKGAARDGAG